MSTIEPTLILDNTIPFPKLPLKPRSPVTDDLAASYQDLDQVSSYKSFYDWDEIRSLEARLANDFPRGGHLFKTPFRLVNAHQTCRQCLYAFEIDTYGRGCTHNCHYCYAKAELTVHGYWNNPFPAPVDLNIVRKTFHKVFETSKSSKWRDVLEKRIPLRIGSMSDSFMWLDKKYGVTVELLKILKHYNYPFIVFTRSDLVATDEYLSLLDPNLCSIHISLSSTNEKMNRLFEPGAPSALRRLKAVEKLRHAGVCTTVRINPVFPIHPDGFFTDPDFKFVGEVPKFDYFSFDMVNEIAAAKPNSILAGFGRFSSYSMNMMEKAAGISIRSFYQNSEILSKRDYHFSSKEIRYYYEQIERRCRDTNVEFTTCYIGNPETMFWSDQDLWHNKSDCCNAKGKVTSFVNDARDIVESERIRLSTSKAFRTLKAQNKELEKP